MRCFRDVSCAASLDAMGLLCDILLFKHRDGWFEVVVEVVWAGERCVVLCWFDPAIVAPRLAWLVEAVAFGGAGWGCGM